MENTNDSKWIKSPGIAKWKKSGSQTLETTKNTSVSKIVNQAKDAQQHRAHLTTRKHLRNLDTTEPKEFCWRLKSRHCGDVFPRYLFAYPTHNVTARTIRMSKRRIMNGTLHHGK